MVVGALPAAVRTQSRRREPYMTDIQEKLIALSEPGYRDFMAPLLPNLPRERILGVRTPALRSYAKELWRAGGYEPFLRQLPHSYYEENNLHAFLLEQMRDFDCCLAELERFLPYIDNWATCDCLRPKVFGKNKARLLARIPAWLASGETYTVRYGIGMLMAHYLDDGFRPEYLSWVADVRSGEYYINMMIAWYFATALAKQYEAALPWLENRRLDRWTHNKTIQKAVESYRVSEKEKAYLKTLKQK